MLDAVLELLPGGAGRSHRPPAGRGRPPIASRYYSKLPPNLADSFVLMIDPMLATGGSAGRRRSI
jgi:uracil phosphoribosyltransferase